MIFFYRQLIATLTTHKISTFCALCVFLSRVLVFFSRAFETREKTARKKRRKKNIILICIHIANIEVATRNGLSTSLK